MNAFISSFMREKNAYICRQFKRDRESERGRERERRQTLKEGEQVTWPIIQI